MRWEDDASGEEAVSVKAEGAYYTAEGDLVVEVSIDNRLFEPISPTLLTLVLSDGKLETETAFYLLDKVEPGTEGVFSLIVPAERLGGRIDLSKMEKILSLKYTKQG